MSDPVDLETLASANLSDESAPKPQHSSISSTLEAEDGLESEMPMPDNTGLTISSTAPSSNPYVRFNALCLNLYIFMSACNVSLLFSRVEVIKQSGNALMHYINYVSI